MQCSAQHDIRSSVTNSTDKIRSLLLSHESSPFNHSTPAAIQLKPHIICVPCTQGLNGPKNNISTSSSFSILFIVKLRCDIIALSSPGNMSAGRAAVSLHTGASFSGHLVSVEPDVTCRYLLLTRHQPAAAAAPMLLSCKPENVI